MHTNIDQLRTEVDDIKKGLDELKNNVSLSEEEKKNKTEVLKAQANATKEKIQNEINSLESKTDNKSKKKVEEAKTLLDSFNETMSLYDSILKSQVSEQSKPSKDEEKGILGKTKDWVGEQRDDVRDKSKWEEELGKNLLRTAGFVATGIGAVSLAVKGIKKLFGKDKKKESKKKKSEKKTRWKRFLTGAGITAGAVFAGTEIYKHWNIIYSTVKEKLGLALNFKEAKQKVEDEVRNGKIDDNHFGAFNSNFEHGITFNEQTQEICSYDQKTKINKQHKKLEGLDVAFGSYEELIHAANIVNFLKRKLRGRGANAHPFMQTAWGGDIAFNCSASGSQELLSASNSNERSWILGTLGTAGGGILGGYCAGVKGAAIGGVTGGLGGYTLGAYIDNTSTAGRCCSTISKGKNFDLFILYLNNLKDESGKSLWESVGEQHINPDETPINQVIDNGREGNERSGVLVEIEDSYGEDQTGRRNLEILWSEETPSDYIIKSYGHQCKITIEGLQDQKVKVPDYSKITKIHIEKYNENDWGNGLDIDFPKTEKGLKEAIRVANLTNMIREDRGGKGRTEYPFDYGKYKMPFSFEIDTGGMGTNYMGGTTILNHDTLKEKYPVLYKDLTKFPSTASVTQSSKNFQQKMQYQAKNDESTGSQYIKFLHQMKYGNGRGFRKKNN